MDPVEKFRTPWAQDIDFVGYHQGSRLIMSETKRDNAQVD